MNLWNCQSTTRYYQSLWMISRTQHVDFALNFSRLRAYDHPTALYRILLAVIVCEIMKRLTKTTLPLLLLCMFVLASCQEPETIRVIITPTPDVAAVVPSPLPSASPTVTPMETPTVVIPPTETDTRTPEPVQPSSTPTTPAPPAVTQQGTPAFGPVIQPNYTMPPVPPPRITPIPEIPTITPTPLPPTDASPGVTEAAMLVTPERTPTAVSRLDAARMGIQIDANLDWNDFQTAIGFAEVTGVHWIKIQVNWEYLQPDAPNEWNERMQLFEQQVELASRPEDSRVLLSIAKAPDWARSIQDESGPPDNPSALADFVTYMLRETKIGPATDAIEIWNEPNLRREWRGTLEFSGAGYMQLFRPTHDAIRAYSSTITVVTAGLAPTSNLPDAVDDRDFLQQMYNAGLGNYRDIAIGVHPYGWANPPDIRCCDQIPGRGWDEDPHFFFIHNIEEMYDIMSRNGHQDLKIWGTEFGWATWEDLPGEPPDGFMDYLSEADQANYSIRAFEIAQDLPYMGPLILWNLNFANQTTVEQGNEIVAYSIINPTVFPQERLLYWLLSQATRDENGQ